MSKSPYRRFVGGILVLGVLGLAYYGGRMRRLGSTDSNSPGTRQNSLSVSGEHVITSQTDSIYTLDEAKEAMANLLTDKWPSGIKTSKQKSNFLRATFTSDIKPADIPALLAALNDYPSSADRTLIAVGVLGRLAETNPDLALPLITQFSDPVERQSLMATAIMTMTRNDPAKAMDLLSSLPAGSISPDGYQSIFAAWAHTNANDAAAFVAKMPASPDRDSALLGIGQAWGYSDPAAALSWASNLPKTDSGVVDAVILGIVPKDSQLAMANLDKISNISNRNKAIITLSGLAFKTPDEALNWLKQVATGDTYQKAVDNIIDGLSFPELKPATTSDGQLTAIHSGTPDLAAAVSALGQITDPAAHTSALAVLASNWSQTSNNDALGWAQSLSGADRATALNAIVGNWLKTDSTGAFTYVQNSSDPSMFASLAPALTLAESQVNPQAALAFAQSLPAGPNQDQAISNALVGLADTNFTSAWDVAAGLPPGTSRDASMSSLVGVEAAKNPTQAVALLDQFSAGPTRNGATRTLSKVWVAQDPQTASIWMNTLPAGSQRNVAVVELIAVQANKDPAAALTWANTITTANTRSNQITKVLTAWVAQDSAAATAAAQSPALNLTDSERAALLQALAKPPKGK